MKHRRLQNLLTGLLILAMLFSLLSTTAFAEEPRETFVAATEKTGTGSIVVTVYDQDPENAGTGAQITQGLSNPVDGVGINAKKIGSVVELTTTTTEEGTVTTNIQVAFGLTEDMAQLVGLNPTRQDYIASNGGTYYYAPGTVQDALANADKATIESSLNSTHDQRHTTGENDGDGAKGIATFSGLDAGVYLLAKSELPAESTTDLAPFLVSVPMYVGDEWKTDVYAYPKVRTASIKNEKTVDDPDKYVNAGQTLKFTITETIPASNAVPGTGQANTFTKFVITDTNISGTLDITEDTIKVLLNDKELTNQVDAEYYTPAYDGTVLTVTLTEKGLEELNKGLSNQQTLKVTYDAKVATDVAFQSTLTNSASLAYRRAGMATDADDATVTASRVNLYTYGIDLTKTLSDNQDSISGNEIQFALYSDQECTTQISMTAGTGAGAGGYWRAADGESPATMSVDAATSHLKLYGLEPGTYYLKETATKTGYTKLDAPITIVITAPTEAGNEPIATVNNATAQVTDGVVSLSVVNTKTEAGFTLPQTGGDGTLLVTAIGLGLLFLGVILLVAYRRKPRT